MLKSSDPPIIVSSEFNVSAEALWSALTDIDEMKKWYFENIPAFEPVVGFETQFAVQSEERLFTHRWKVMEVVPLKSITYSWEYKEYPGRALVTFELMEERSQIKLKLVNQVLEDFPHDIPEFQRSSCQAGWDYFIGDRLMRYFDGI